MAYENKNTGEIGSLFKLLPNISNPICFSEEELLGLGIEKHIPEIIEVVKTLEELKTERLTQLSNEVHTFVLDKYPYYKQLSALNGTYDEATNTEIKSWCDTEVKRAQSVKEAINQASTVEELELIYYIKYIYDENDLELIETKFWGE